MHVQEAHSADRHEKTQGSSGTFTSGGVIRAVLFFLHLGFVPLGFPDKVLMRQHPKRIMNPMVMTFKGECYKSCVNVNVHNLCISIYLLD